MTLLDFMSFTMGEVPQNEQKSVETDWNTQHTNDPV